MNNTTINLSAFGFSKYNLCIDGRLYKTDETPIEIKKDSINRFYIINDMGNKKRIALKDLYKKVFNRQFSIDTITSLPNEEWKEIENTNGKYYISNCGRVKSLCGYKAIVLQYYKKANGYLTVKINGKNVFVHRLVAFAFCENKYKDQIVQIHHKNGNKVDNNYSNLEILSIKEHQKRHSKKENTDNENVLS